MYSLITVGSIVAIVVFVVLFVANMYKRCSSDEILVVFGSFLGGAKALCIHGGGRIVLPLVQGYKYISLKPMTLEIDLHNSLSKNNIRVSVPSAFTIAIGTEPETMNNAAQRLLNFTPAQIAEQAKEIIIGQLRQVVASMTIEEINGNRDSFLAKVTEDVEGELKKIGLHIITPNFRDLTDDVGYIDAIGKKAASEAINKAKVDVAEQDKKGAVGEAIANTERAVKTAEQKALENIGKKEQEKEEKVKSAEFEAEKVKGENEAKAKVAEANAILSEKEADALRRGDVAKANAQKAILEAEKATEQAKLEKEELAKEEVEKKKIQVQAQAEAERTRTIAQGKADAVKMEYEAQAEGIRKVLEAKAEGVRKYVEASGGNTQSASAMMLIELLPELVKTQVKALENIKIDKVVVMDGGNGGDNGVGGFVKGLMNSLPQVHEVAKSVGVELPEFLGSAVKEEPKKVESKPDEKKDK